MVVGLSGGVDSSTAAYLLKQEGYEVVGIFLHLWKGNNPRSCCSVEAGEFARQTAEFLSIPFYAVNSEERFKEKVVNFFVRGYERGSTPNACVECNREIKFEWLFQQAKAVGAERVATGHYARILQNYTTKEYELHKGIDVQKDQAYFLYTLKSEWLPKILFPLGNRTKKEVREIARQAGLSNATRRESQDLCFLNGKGEKFFPVREGEIVDEEGRVLGHHRGVPFYAVGQRKGLGIPSTEPLFVKEKRAELNQVMVARREKLWGNRIRVERVRFLASRPATSFTCQVKHRAGAEEVPAEVSYDERMNTALLTLKQPVWAPAPGQSAVFYDGSRVLGGGVIHSVLS